MAGNDLETRISFDAPDRRSLVVLLCQELNSVLTTEQAWEHGCVLHHWQVSAPAFTELPDQVIQVVLEAWESAGSRLDEIECSGYLETDNGPRAWGFVAVRPGQRPIQRRPHIENVQLLPADNGFHFSARVVRQPHDAESDEQRTFQDRVTRSRPGGEHAEADPDI